MFAGAGQPHTESRCFFGNFGGKSPKLSCSVSNVLFLIKLVADRPSRIIDKLNPILDSQVETMVTLQRFSKELEDNMADLWTAIHEREDLLEDLVHEKQRENAELVLSLQQDVQAKESELLEQSRLLQDMNEALEQRQGMTEELRNDIAELEENQASYLEQSGHLERLGAECEKLKAEAAEKNAHVEQLRNKLQESKSLMESQTQEHNQKTESLRRLMEEQIARAHTAQVHAVEHAQREALHEMNKTKTDFENRLSHALEQRAALQEELNNAKVQALALEEDSNCHAEKLAVLETELEKVRSEGSDTREDAKQKDEAHRTILEEQLKRVEDLESQLAVREKKFDNLAANARAYDKAAFAILCSLRKWSENHTTIQELASEMVQSKCNERQKIDSRFRSLWEMQILQKAIMKHCQNQEKAVGMLTDLHQDISDGATPAGAIAESMAPPSVLGSSHVSRNWKTPDDTLLDRARHVTLRSPAETGPHPRPPSVNTEQERRRAAEPPKSIMKAVAYSISSGILLPNSQQQSSQRGDETRQQQHNPGRARLTGQDTSTEKPRLQPRENSKKDMTQDRTMLNHGPYNRPVARSNGRQNDPVDAALNGESQAPTSCLEAPGEADGRPLIASSRKRQEASEQPQDGPKKRFKWHAMTISTPRIAIQDAENLLAAPRKRKQSSVDRQPRSPSRTSQLRQASHPNQFAGDVPNNGPDTALQPSRRPSGTKFSDVTKDGNKDHLGSHHQRRQSILEDQVSEDLVVVSQDVQGISPASLPMARKFSAMP